MQFLTIIGITISTACFGCGLLADMTNSHTLFTCKNYLSLVAAPMEIVISILYWGLRAVDTSLVVPPDMVLPPLGADLAFHLIPAVVLAVDAVLLSPPWPSSPMNPQAPLLTLAVSTSIAFAYWWWIVSSFRLTLEVVLMLSVRKSATRIMGTTPIRCSSS
jgi:hypothetical protein